MPDTPAGQAPAESHVSTAFLGTRLLHAVFYAVIAWFTFWVVLILAALQFIVVIAYGRANAELQGFNRVLIQYLWELLAYIAFVRDEKPFPIGSFPKAE